MRWYFRSLFVPGARTDDPTDDAGHVTNDKVANNNCPVSNANLPRKTRHLILRPRASPPAGCRRRMATDVYLRLFRFLFVLSEIGTRHDDSGTGRGVRRLLAAARIARQR